MPKVLEVFLNLFALGNILFALLSSAASRRSGGASDRLIVIAYLSAIWLIAGAIVALGWAR